MSAGLLEVWLVKRGPFVVGVFVCREAAEAWIASRTDGVRFSVKREPVLP